MRNIDMGIARKWAEELHEQVLQQGDIAIDATMGNGYDTLRLCRLVGKEGKVYAFDVQPEAIESTRARLIEADAAQQAQLILSGHQNVKEYIKEEVHLAVFNLGWLPGIEHAIRTRLETTLEAVNACLDLLAPGGVLTVCIYPGHEEGKEELTGLLSWAEGLDPLVYDAVVRRYLNQPLDPPVLIAVKKAEKKRRPRRRP